jgi:uncharacterized protein (DUF1697 family)
MSLVVFVKGVNVGGHRRFRPSLLARDLGRLDVVSIGAAGTFVVRSPTSRTELRAQIERRLPFPADVVICAGSDVLRLLSLDPFAGRTTGPDVIRFVSVMVRRRSVTRRLPLTLPSEGDWCVRVLGSRDRFIWGLHRREMRAIRYLGRLEKAVGAPLTTRSWNTFSRIGRLLEE